MTQLPLAGQLILASVALLLLGLCIATAYASLRAATRRRVARWSGLRMLAFVVVAGVPWLLVRLAPPAVNVSIHGIGPLLGWLLVAALTFAILVLLPLGVLLTGAVWIVARRRTGP